MQIEFIKAREENAAGIARLRQQVWVSTYRGIYPDNMIDEFDFEWHAHKDMHRIKNHAYEVFLIRCGRENAGYMILQKKQGLLLQSLYVLKEYHKRGIGRRAFEYLREYCIQNGFSRFTCHCHPRNESALGFYRKMGGVKVGEDVGNEEEWQDSVILEFRIDGEKA